MQRGGWLVVAALILAWAWAPVRSHDGMWETEAYRAEAFSASDGLTWVVPPTSVQTYAALPIGANTVLVRFELAETGVLGAGEFLRVAIPSGAVGQRWGLDRFAAARSTALCRGLDAGLEVTVIAFVVPHEPWIYLAQPGRAPWHASQDATTVQCHIPIEVQLWL